MIKVLFVCLGNICRSPMAEGVFANLVREAGLEDKIEIDSAGTGSWHIGEKAHRGTLAVLDKNRIPYNGRARRLTRDDLKTYDYIIPMDEENLADIKTLGSVKGKMALLLSFAPELGVSEVPDPYFD